MEYIDGAPDDLAKVEQNRERERLRKREQRGRKKAAEGLIPDKARPAPARLRQKLGELNQAVAPLGPGEASRQLKHAATATAKLLRSDAQFDDDEFDDAGAAFADLSKVVWPLRLFIRVLVPLVLFGALWSIGAKIATGTPWWQRRQEKKRDKEKAESGHLRVLQAPDGQLLAAPGQVPPPGMLRIRKGPFPI